MFLTQMFETPEKYLGSYSDTKVNNGLWFLVSETFFDGFSALLNPSVPLIRRQRCAHSIFNLFQEYFASRCSMALGHLDKTGFKPLNEVCYMWWDFLHYSDLHWEYCFENGMVLHPACTGVYDDLLSVMSKILTLPNDACQESALHGLGHWHKRRPTQVAAIIDHFLNRTPNIRPDLRAYAVHARAGGVL